MPTDWDHHVLTDAGVSTRHLQMLLPDISRPTLSGWLNGRCRPHRFLINRAMAVQHAVTAAMEAGELPITAKHLTDRERDLKIQRVLKAHLSERDD